MALTFFSRRSTKPPGRAGTAHPAPGPAQEARGGGDPLTAALRLGRLGLIVQHPQRWAEHPEFEKVWRAALRAVDEYFAIVPDGFVSLAQSLSEEPGAPELDRQTKAFLLARYAVTNADFQRFVDHGGYADLELWPEDIWPHLIDFKDQTGQPGPRFWREGRYPRELASHPVVGLCYYEAVAYARWAGYRLPREAEWQMAASWRIRSSAGSPRRYPWGDALDLSRCNIWASGHGHTLPVDACLDGAAPNGVLQLIGNVWEWTACDFQCTDHEGRPIVGDALLKTIRGGAYDTYFPWQATSTFRSGLGCLSRCHNVGFRVAMDLPGEPTGPGSPGQVE